MKQEKIKKMHPSGGITKLRLYTSIMYLASRHTFTTQQNEYIKQSPVKWAQLVPTFLIVGKISLQ